MQKTMQTLSRRKSERADFTALKSQLSEFKRIDNEVNEAEKENYARMEQRNRTGTMAAAGSVKKKIGTGCKAGNKKVGVRKDQSSRALAAGFEQYYAPLEGVARPKRLKPPGLKKSKTKVLQEQAADLMAESIEAEQFIT